MTEKIGARKIFLIVVSLVFLCERYDLGATQLAVPYVVYGATGGTLSCGAFTASTYERLTSCGSWASCPVPATSTAITGLL